MLSLKSVYPQEELEAQKNLQVCYLRGSVDKFGYTLSQVLAASVAGRPWLLHKLGSGKVQISSLSCLREVSKNFADFCLAVRGTTSMQFSASVQLIGLTGLRQPLENP
eukprot:942026-Pelagomonas_calceolata.AAC.2